MRLCHLGNSEFSAADMGWGPQQMWAGTYSTSSCLCSHVPTPTHAYLLTFDLASFMISAATVSYLRRPRVPLSLDTLDMEVPQVVGHSLCELAVLSLLVDVRSLLD